MPAFNSLIHRAISIPMNSNDFNKEIDIIKQIAKNNGYKIKDINNLILKHKNKNNNSLNTKVNENVKYIGAIYTTELPYTLNNTMKKYNYKIGFRTDNKLEKLLKTKNKNNNNGDDFIKKAGVYKINCESCDKIYIGQTGRSFKERFKEHIPKTENLTPQKILDINTKFALHIIDTNHKYTDIYTNLTPIHYCNKGKYLDTLEEYEIYKQTKSDKNKLLNDKLIYKNNVLFDRIIENSQM